MFDQLLTPEYIVFSISFVLMLGIGLVEAVGLGVGHLDLDADVGEPGGAAVFGWLGIRSGLPILVWLTSLLACFTLIGLAVQQVAQGAFGAPLPAWIAVPIALFVGLVANAFFSGVVVRFFPEFETTVIDREQLLRCRATVLEGTASRGRPARAKVVDQHGQAHYVMIEPHDDGESMAAGDTGLLVRKDDRIFFMLNETNQFLTNN